MNLKASLIHPQIVHVKYKNQYDLASSFMRIQEFYESPIEGIKGCSFTLETFMDKYAKEYGVFDYFEKWAGFNVPSDVLKDFIETQGIFYTKELRLINYIKNLVDWDKPFYVIGTFQDVDIDHELAHAFYYISKDYKKKMKKLLNELPSSDRIGLVDELKEKGYHSDVFTDEIQAYLSSCSDFILNFKVADVALINEFSKVLTSEKQKLLS